MSPKAQTFISHHKHYENRHDYNKLCYESQVKDYESENENDAQKEDHDIHILHLNEDEVNEEQQEKYPDCSDAEKSWNRTNHELLTLHQKYSQISMNRLQHMARRGMFPKRLAKCNIPICRACLYSKETKRPWKLSHSIIRMVYKVTKVGQVVSVDQLISPTPGLIAQMLGLPTTLRYTCATIYVDHYSDCTYLHLQHSQDAEQTLKGKIAFESMAATHGIKIKHYHADNGIFNANLWRESCKTKQQGLSFAGVNAHHQNGVAERKIGILTELTRTNLNHTCQKWPGVITYNLWPYAMRMAVEAINHTVTAKSNFTNTPHNIFSNLRAEVRTYEWHHFGCPACVLKAELQTSTQIFHKWKERSRLGVYLGKSLQHASNVYLILNIETGLTSPQFHVKLDSSFNTIKDVNFEPTWQVICGFVSRPKSYKRKREDVDNKPNEHETKIGNEGFNLNIEPETFKENILNIKGLEGDELLSNQDLNIHKGWRSTRDKTSTERLTYAYVTELINTYQNDIKGGVLNGLIYDHELVTMSSTMDPDTMYLHEARKQPDWLEFKKAMKTEIRAHIQNESFKIIKRKDIDKNIKISKSVWAMKHKRRVSDGTIYKWRARLNIDGSQQVENIHYEFSFSPVVTWENSRCIILLSIINRWPTKQIDYIQAFPQVPVERPMVI